MLKAVDTDKTVEVVWPKDPAIDMEGSDIQGYADGFEKGLFRWQDHLKIKEGMAPTVFHVGPIPLHRMLAVMEQSGDVRFVRAFMWGLRGIDNCGFMAQTTDPNSGKVKKEIPTYEESGIKYVRPEWLQGVMAGPLYQCACFVGAAALAFNVFREEDLKNS